MARFIANIKGQRGAASRLGSKSSGIVAIVSGWDSGVRVVAYVDETGADRFEVYATGGSNRASNERLIHSVRGPHD